MAFKSMTHTWQSKRQEWQPLALCSWDPKDTIIISLIPSHSRVCLADSVPEWTPAPVLSTKKCKPNIFCKFLLSKQTEPVTTHPQNLMQVSSLHRAPTPMNPSSSLAQESAKHIRHWLIFPNSLAISVPCPNFLTSISLLTLPWEEDELKHTPELKLQFTLWIWN